MTLQEIYDVHVVLDATLYIGIQQVGVHHIHMAITFMDKMDKGDDIDSNHMLHLAFKQIKQLEREVDSRTLSDKN